MMENENQNQNPKDSLLELQESFSEREIRDTLKDVLYVFDVDNQEEIVDVLINEMNDRKIMSRREVEQFLTKLR